MVPDPHLLIVDDDERIRGLLQKFLMRNGFLVSVARDASQARKILAGLEFDLIVMDVMMPGEDGVTLTRELRKRMGTPILLLTARGEAAHHRALVAGRDDGDRMRTHGAQRIVEEFAHLAASLPGPDGTQADHEATYGLAARLDRAIDHQSRYRQTMGC